MSTAAMISLGVFAWILLSILLALFIGRMIQARDRQRPDRIPPVELSATEPTRAASPPRQPGQDRRDEP